MSIQTLSRSSSCAILLALCIAAPGGAQRAKAGAGPSRYLYVWAGTGGDTTRGVDMMTVIDADPSSRRYGDRGAATPGVSYHRASFPSGVMGMAMPHGAVFVR